MTALLAVAILPTSISTAVADDHDLSWRGSLSGDSATVGGGLGYGPRAEDGSRAQPASNAGQTQVPFVYTMVPACSGNGPDVGVDALCLGATITCPPGQVMYWLYRAPAGTTYGSPGWQQTDQRCVVPPAPGTPPAVIPGLTLEDFQRLPLPAGTTNVQPDNGYTLINVPTNVYATAEPVVLDTDLLGFAVQVRATPASYTWDFGDATTLGPTDDPGAPYPDLRTTHTYDSAGPYAITLTTTYTGEYSVAGGPWLPVPGQAQVTSAPVPVEALSGRNRLVADPVDN